MADTPDTPEDINKDAADFFQNIKAALESATTKVVIKNDNLTKKYEDMQSKLQEAIQVVESLGDKASPEIRKFADECEEAREMIEKLKNHTSENNKKVEKLLKNYDVFNKKLLSFTKGLAISTAGTPLPTKPPSAPSSITSPSPSESEIKVNKILAGGLEVKGGAIKGGGGGGEDVASAVEKIRAEGTKKWRSQVAGQIADYTALIVGSRDIFQAAFRGSFNDATIFRKEMRKVAYQVDGISSAARGMQNEFTDLGKNIVAQTGVPLEETQEAYLRNIKKGILSIGSENKMRKDGLKVIKSGLHMSTMIGSDAQQTADLFGDWYRTLGLSADKMSRLAIDSKNIARSTGLTGNELLEAMKSSEKILQNLKNQGNLTNEAMQNVITTVAEAKKLGVEESSARLLDAMTSTNKLFFEADSKIKGYMLRVGAGLGKQREMMSGRFAQSAGNMKKMSEMMAADLSRLSGGLINNIDNIEDQLAGLSDEQLTRLSVGIKALTGMEIDEFTRNAKAFAKGGRGLNGTLEDLEKIMKSSVSTVDERRKAEKDYGEAIMAAGLSSIAGAKEATGPDKGKSIAGFLDEMKGGQLETFNANAEAIAKSLGKTTTGMSQQEKFLMMSTTAAQKLEEAAKAQGVRSEDFSSQLEQAIKAGDEKKYREIASRMEDVQKEVGIKEAKAVDPITELGHKIEKTNEYLRRLVSSVFGRLIDAFGATGIGLALLGANLTALAFSFEGTFDKFTGFLKPFFKPMITGFTRARAANKGFFESLERGLSGQMKSMKNAKITKQVTKGATKAKESLDLFKNTKIAPALDAIGDKGASAIEKIGGQVDNLWTISKNKFTNFFRHFDKGFMRAIKRGDSFSSAISKGISRQFRINANSLFKYLNSGFRKVFNNLSSMFANLGPNISSLSKKVPGAIGNIYAAIKKVPGAIGDAYAAIKKVPGAVADMYSATKNNINRIRSGIGKIFDPFDKGFRRAIKSGKGFSEAFGRGIAGQFKAIKYSKIMKPIVATDIFKNLEKGFLTLKATLKAGGIKGLFGMVSKAWRGGFAAIKGSIVAGTAGTAAIVFAAIDGIMGAFNGFFKTGERFEGVLKAMGKSTKDLTWGMYAASTTAGAFVGILDGLTFGLLGLSGAAEWLEKGLTMTLYAIFAVIEGIVDGIIYAFKPVSQAFSYIGQQFSNVGGAVIKVFNSIASIFGGSVSDMSDVLAILYPILKNVGFAIGWLAGLVLSLPIWLLVKAISLLIVPIEMLANAISFVIDLASGLVKLLTLQINFSEFGKIILDGFKGILSPIVNFLWSLGADLFSPFKWLYDILVGHSIIPDLVWGIASWFAKLPFLLLSGLAKLPFMLINFLVKGLLELPGMLVNSIINGVTSLMQMIPSAIYNALYWAASTVGLGWLVKKLGGGGEGGGEGESIASKVSAGVSAAIESAKGLWEGAKGVASNLWQGAKGVASKAIEYHPMNLAMKGASKLVESGPAIWDGIKSFFGFKKDKTAEASQSLNNGLTNQSYDKHAIPTAMPTSVQPTTGEAQPVHLGDVGQAILRDKAGAEGSKLQSDELARMEEASNQQVSELEQIRQGIEELVSLMKPRGGGAGIAADSYQTAGSTKDLRRPTSSAIYGKMTSGKIVSGANKGVINTGPSN